MKDRLNFILLIAGLTVGGIIIYQFYWVYFNYKTSKENFILTANYALRSSIDNYQLSQNRLPTSLKYKRPSLTFFMRTIPAQDPIALDTPLSNRRFNAEFSTVSVDSNQLPLVKTLVARLLSQQQHKAINLDTLGRYFKTALLQSQISDAFELSLKRGVYIIKPDEVASVINFYKDPIKIEAHLKRPNAFFLRHNTGPVLVSSILIILSAGSLLYMGRIIKRQMLLDNTKTDFINNITHELRTPITILKSSNEALAKFGAAEQADSLARHLSINDTVLNNLESSIERILEFSRSEQGKLVPKFETFQLDQLVLSVIEHFNMSQNINISLKFDPVPFEITSDRFMLKAILNNLIDNAIKYSPAGPEIAITACKDNSQWELKVSDKGLGIDKADQPYIFDKFYRVGTGDVQDVKGYGIGLAYVHQLMSVLKGKISVISEINKGTTLILTFFN